MNDVMTQRHKLAQVTKRRHSFAYIESVIPKIGLFIIKMSCKYLVLDLYTKSVIFFTA